MLLEARSDFSKHARNQIKLYNMNNTLGTTLRFLKTCSKSNIDLQLWIILRVCYQLHLQLRQTLIRSLFRIQDEIVLNWGNINIMLEVGSTLRFRKTYCRYRLIVPFSYQYLYITMTKRPKVPSLYRYKKKLWFMIR